MVYWENNNQYEYQQENYDGNINSNEFKEYQKEVSAPIVDNKLIDLETNTQNQLRFSALLSTISEVKSELTDAKYRRGKEVRKTVRYIKERFDKLEFNIKEVQSGKYTNLKQQHINWLILKTQTLLHDATDYKSQLVTGDLDEAKRYFPPNIFNDAWYYIPDIKTGDFDKKKSNTQTIDTQVTTYDRKQDCDPKNYMKFNSGKEALAYSPLAWVQHQANQINSNGYIGETGKWLLVWWSRAIPKVADLVIKWVLWWNTIKNTAKGIWWALRAGWDKAARDKALWEIGKWAAFGAWRFWYSQIKRGKLWREYAGSAILEKEWFRKPTNNIEANTQLNYPARTSTLLWMIPFWVLSPMLHYNSNGKVESIDMPLLKNHIQTSNLTDKDRQIMLSAYEYLEKEKDMKAIQSAFNTVGLDKNTIEQNINDTSKWSFIYWYKEYNDKITQEEKKKKEKINNSGEVYDGKDIANVKPYLEQIDRDITEPKIKEKYTVGFQSRLEKKLNILYMQHPKSAPIEIYFDKTTNKLNLKSYNQISTLDILSEKDIISIPYSATSRSASSLEEAVNIGQLMNLLTAPNPIGFAGASQKEDPFNIARETERDIEFSKTSLRDRNTIKNLEFKKYIDTNILDDTRFNNFDVNFPSINNNKSWFINWLNEFKKNGKSLWKK